MRKIKITLHKDGTQRIEVLGCTGAECVALTRDLEARLGTPVGERLLKPEYEQTESEVEPEQERER